MNDQVEIVESTETKGSIDTIVNIKRNRLTPFMKTFIDKMSYFLPELDLTYNEDFQFVDETTRQHFAAYQLGWNARINHEPGVYVLARLTERGMEFAQTPYLMDSYKTATTAMTRMSKRHKGQFFIFSASKGAFEVIKKMAGKSFGRLRTEEDMAIPVVISDRPSQSKDEKA